MTETTPRRVLLLAGTTEAAELAALLTGRDDLYLVASFAGRTAGAGSGFEAHEVRIGGFGGVDGLVAALRDGHFDAVVDATHPFAVQMAAHAAEAAAVTATPHVRIVRPAWEPDSREGDDWRLVPDLDAVAASLEHLGARSVVLTTGRMRLDPFAPLARRGVRFVVRSVESADTAELPGAAFVTAKGPFDLASERALLAEYGIDCLVTRNSGGPLGAKLLAAREACIPVVMVQRPVQPDGPVVETAAGAMSWLESVLPARVAS